MNREIIFKRVRMSQANECIIPPNARGYELLGEISVGFFAPHDKEVVEPTDIYTKKAPVYERIKPEKSLWSSPPEKEVCPTCNGSGKTYQVIGRDKDGNAIWGYDVCEYCGGSGYVSSNG